MGAKNNDFRSSYASVHLDLIRGLSALAVLVGHLRAVFFVDYQDVQAPGFIVRLFYLISGFGHQAVMVFFVLSGYFISSSIFQSCRASRWSWRAYAINRVSRLYIVLIPGLFLTMAWDYCGMALFPHHPLYGGQLAPAVVPDAVANRYSLTAFLGNLACLQNISVLPLGSNGALWSLSNEFWYYAIFPVLAIPFCLKTGIGRMATSMAAGALLLWFVGTAHALYFLVWFFGVGVALLSADKRRHPASQWLLVPSCLLFLLALGAVRFQVLAHALAGDFLVGGSFALLVFALLQWQSPCARDVYHKLSSGLAGFSYSLYVFHLPVVVFLGAWTLTDRKWQPSGGHLVYVFVLLVLITAWTFLLSRLTEAYTERMRRFLLHLTFPTWHGAIPAPERGCQTTATI
jgi:peptidoglycan/LPS O-acetylase OafA/YrhL